MTKQRILIISDAWEPQVNGVVRTYQFLVRVLERLGHVVRAIGPHEFPLTVPMPGYAEIRLAIRPRRGLYRMIDEFKPDLIHIATEGPLGWAARDWCRIHKHPFTTAYHTHFPAYVHERTKGWGGALSRFCTGSMATYLRRFHKPAAAVLVSTQTLADILAQDNYKPPRILMTRGVDTDLFKPDGPRAVFNRPGPVALYVGRVAVEKNLEDFLNMPWEGVKVIVGDGPCRLDYQSRYPDALFAGLRTGAELASFYRAADVFVFPSKTDTFGMVLVEAMACGVPIAAYRVPGPIDIITEPFLGVLGDDLATCATAALNCGTQTARSLHARTHYTWDVAAHQFLESYNPSCPRL